MVDWSLYSVNLIIVTLLYKKSFCVFPWLFIIWAQFTSSIPYFTRLPSYHKFYASHAKLLQIPKYDIFSVMAIALCCATVSASWTHLSISLISSPTRPSWNLPVSLQCPSLVCSWHPMGPLGQNLYWAHSTEIANIERKHLGKKNPILLSLVFSLFFEL